MRRLVIITDKEPHVKHLLNSWEVASGRIEGSILTVSMRNKARLTVEAIDPQMAADIILSHDPSSEIVTGKLGIQSVVYDEPPAEECDAKEQFIRALKTLLREDD